jgi:hypothetical protein
MPTTSATISAVLIILRLDEPGRPRMRSDHLLADDKAPRKIGEVAIGAAAFVGGESDDSEDNSLLLGFD